MEFPLKQYMCSDCGQTSDILDPDAKLPAGWLMISRFTHYCPKCAEKHREEEEI